MVKQMARELMGGRVRGRTEEVEWLEDRKYCRSGVGENMKQLVRWAGKLTIIIEKMLIRFCEILMSFDDLR